MKQPKSIKPDNPSKPREWFPAFYYLAEHIRVLTNGEINHKDLYAFVGTEGRFINHPNAKIRKALAAALSKLVHSKTYADHMRARYLMNSRVFDDAAAEICGDVFRILEWDDDALRDYWATKCWPDVWRGLVNERMEWRATLDLVRIEQEARYVFGASDEAGGDSRAVDMSAVEQLSAMFRFISFGYLDVPMGNRPTEDPEDTLRSKMDEDLLACLVKSEDPECMIVSNLYPLPMKRPFMIGRLTDSDAIEVNPTVGRRHGCVFCKSGVWYYEDQKSRNGSAILRGEERIKLHDREDFSRINLEEGDVIEVAVGSYYRFGMYKGANRPLS